MKICMICPELGNSGGNAFIGGHANTVVQLSKHLDDRGHEVTIITTPHRYPGNNPDRDVLRDYAEVFTLTISGPYSSFRYGLEFCLKTIQKIKELKNKNFDIIHGNSGYTMPAMITGISSKLVNIPSVQTIYCPIEPLFDNYNICRIFSNNILSKLYLMQITKIIATTRNVKRSLIKAGISKDRIVEIPPGINTEIYRPDISGMHVRKKYNIGPDQPTLVYVGNLTKIKGLHILIDALSIVVKKIPEIKLIMVLNMPIDAYDKPNRLDIDIGLIFDIKEKISLYGLEKNIIPLGLTDNMAQVIAAGDVFVTPFLNTVGVVDYPVSMLEAMAVGKPVIATNVGGIPEIIEHLKSGLLVEPNDQYGLSDAIFYVINKREESKKIGIEGSKIISERFRMQTIVTKLEMIYELAKK